MTRIDRGHLSGLLAGDRAQFAVRNPRSAAAYERGKAHLFGGVPMTWMNKTAGDFPLCLEALMGVRLDDRAGNPRRRRLPERQRLRRRPPIPRSAIIRMSTWPIVACSSPRFTTWR
jgi:hypothetical protein